jgi:4a-hydroxytetrahydrobiopterin dehydratase
MVRGRGKTLLPGRGGAGPGMQDGRAHVNGLVFPAGWRIENEGRRASLHVKTKDFVEAVRLVERVAAIAEELEHHPDVHITQYNQLRIETWSHDVGGLTRRDVRLAERLDALFQDAGVKTTT